MWVYSIYETITSDSIVYWVTDWKKYKIKNNIPKSSKDIYSSKIVPYMNLLAHKFHELCWYVNLPLDNHACFSIL